MAVKKLFDVSDYDEYVRQLPVNERTPELVNARMVMAARPTYRHMIYAQGLFRAIDAYVNDHQVEGHILTEFEIVIGNHTVLIPDIAFALQTNSLGRLTEERYYGAPDLVCEIASKSTREYDAQEKFVAYLQAGVREYWLVDPEKPVGERFTVFTRIEQDATSTMPAFREIAGHDPAASLIFPGIAVADDLR